MKYTRVFLEAIGYELAPDVITSDWIERRMESLYKKLHLQYGQFEVLTGIRERRWWKSPHVNATEASKAAKKALEESNIPVSEIGALVYGGVCRDQFEPATACAVAHNLGLNPKAVIFDISNACLGVVNGIIDIANRIELGQIKAGVVVACETAREITEIMMEQMIQEGTMDFFKKAFATLTGGSGAAAVILSDGSFGGEKACLKGGVAMAAPEHNEMCRWGMDKRNPPRASQYIETDGIGLLKHGGELIKKIGTFFLEELNWKKEDIDKVISHQVAAANRDAILNALGLPIEKDFSTFQYLGNMGTVSLPITAAVATERGFLKHGDKVAFVGIGSGLNSMMLGWEW
ncbi:MAG: 3-oxoacyl-ACP synthase III [Candidatus Riflebacteria bacterium]|nr:3-oxoacyl-ACP synthase III [Candidatus Riflebacteria bacterium]